MRKREARYLTEFKTKKGFLEILIPAKNQNKAISKALKISEKGETIRIQKGSDIVGMIRFPYYFAKRLKRII